jgi:hypothetical protein
MSRHDTGAGEGFFELYHNSPYNRQFPWAYSITPPLATIGQRCNVCTNGYLFPGWYPDAPLTVSVNTGRKYPDVLGCGAYPLLIVSQAVLDDWSAVGLRGYEAFPLSVRAEPGAPRLAAPIYYHLKITGRCELDTDAMGIKVLFSCPRCLYREIEPITDHALIMKRDTWDGSDLFSSDLFPMVTFCTESVQKLATQNSRTNFRFESLPVF